MTDDAMKAGFLKYLSECCLGEIYKGNESS